MPRDTVAERDTPDPRALNICERALEMTGTERALYLTAACGADSDLRASVDTVLNAMDDAGSFLDDALVDDWDRVGSRVGPFELTELIGTGGMGAVFLAKRMDAEFEQQVAIKIVRGQFIAPELKRRFETERQILANLNHPYIASLIDAGTLDDGAPYLVMEYIGGVPVDAYCDKAALSLPQRVALIRKIATAVQAAHQSLIIHRDLKPSNVLVTADGIPKLLDFGIAKLVEPESGETAGNTTVYGSQALTPNYASPEQVLENRVTTASDVYSLGILAYELLAGERPYFINATTPAELLDSFNTLNIPRPSTRLATVQKAELRDEIAKRRATDPVRLRKALSGDLDNILLKALDTEPERRYETASAFSADLRRYSEGLPVEAAGNSARYRLKRFVARNKLAVGAAGVVAVSVLAALGVSTWAYFQAETARAEADARFNQVREIAGTMMFDVYDEVGKLRGATRARELLATSAQQYLESLSTSSMSSPELQLDVGRGYARLASVIGGVDDLSLGDRFSAMAQYQKAESVLTKLVEDVPDNDDYRTALAQLHAEIAAHTLYGDNDIPLARSYAVKSVANYAALSSFDEERRHGQVRALIELADTYDWDGDFAKTIEILELAMIEAKALDTNPETSPKGAQALAQIHRDMGEAYYYLDDMERSLVELRKALPLNEAAVKFADNVPGAERSLAITLWSLAGVEHDADESEASVATINRAQALARRMLDASPDDNGTQTLYSTIAQQRSTILSEAGQHNEAIRQAKESYRMQLSMNDANQDDPGGYRELTIDIFNLGYVYLAADNEQACPWLSEAHERMLSQQTAGTLTGFDEKTLLPDIAEAHTEACSAE